MKSHEKAQSEANQHEDQEEDTDILVVPIRFVIRKIIAGHGMLDSQWFLRIAAAVQPTGKSVIGPGDTEIPEPQRKARQAKQRFLQLGR